MHAFEDDKRKIDDPQLNQDASTYNQNESFEDSDDFHKYDDTAANVDDEDPVSKSAEATNANSRNSVPTFTRTYERNASDIDKSGMHDGHIAI